MQDSSTAVGSVLQFRQDLLTKLRDGVRRAIETVLEEELLSALGADAHERTAGRQGWARRSETRPFAAQKVDHLRV